MRICAAKSSLNFSALSNFQAMRFDVCMSRTITVTSAILIQKELPTKRSDTRFLLAIGESILWLPAHDVNNTQMLIALLLATFLALMLWHLPSCVNHSDARTNDLLQHKVVQSLLDT